MFVIKASTPEAMRNEIVKWLNQQASNCRIAASKIRTVNAKAIELARATTYQGAADFLKGCTVEDSSMQNTPETRNSYTPWL